MKKVTGLGGVFFKSDDPKKTMDWYRRHLGLETDEYGAMFKWYESPESQQAAGTQWSVFKKDTTYFDPSTQPFMINYRVHDLEALVAQLREEGVEIVDEMETYEYGKFIHIVDPDGMKIELWEPVDAGFDAN